VAYVAVNPIVAHHANRTAGVDGGIGCGKPSAGIPFHHSGRHTLGDLVVDARLADLRDEDLGADC
jgi:hypothetical protein